MQAVDPAAGGIQQFRHDPNNPRSLSHDRTRTAYQDLQGRIWIGANNVINLYDSTTRSFKRYPNPAFPYAVYARPIGSDTKGKLWIDYGSGLSLLDPSNGTLRNFDGSCGLCGSTKDMKHHSRGAECFLQGLGG